MGGLVGGERGVQQSGLAAQQGVGLGGVGGRAAPREAQDDAQVGRPQVIEVPVHVPRDPVVGHCPDGTLLCG